MTTFTEKLVFLCDENELAVNYLIIYGLCLSVLFEVYTVSLL